MRGAPYQQQHGHQHRHDDPSKDAFEEHCAECNHRNDEFVTTDFPHMPKFTDVDQTFDRHQDNRGKNDAGEVGERNRQVHQA